MLKLPSKNIFQIFDSVLKEINPFQVLLGAVEETKDNYRLEINMKYINELMHIEVLEEAESLLELDILAREGKIVSRGEYYVGDYFLADFLRVKEIGFNADFIPIWVKGNQVRFRVENFRVWNKARKKFDIVKWIAKLFPYNRTLILRELVSLYPNILSLTRLQNEVRLNLNYFLKKANISPESVKIHKVKLETNKLIFYLRSTIALKPLADFFGADAIRVFSISHSESL